MHAVQSVLDESYTAQRPIIDEEGKALRRHQGSAMEQRLLLPHLHSRSVTSEGHQVTKMTGTHARSIFFAQEVQTRYRPEGFELR